jgi:gamma-glutamyl:cysteine ligase YbdK (ATP-grasp superfamily)
MTQEQETHQPKPTHKAMGELAPSFVFPPELQPFNKVNFSTEGGLLVDYQGIPQFSVRPPFWRTQEFDPIVRENDVLPLYRRKGLVKTIPFTHIDTGGELELYSWSPDTQDVYQIMAPHSPIVASLEEYNSNGGNGFHFEEKVDIFDVNPENISFSAELAQSCLEFNTEHSPDAYRRGIRQLKALQIIAKLTELQGAYLIPVAAFPHRPLEAAETNPNRYVQRIAMEYMGWEKVQHFIGASWQTHIEMMTLETGLASINYLQQVTPIIYALTLAGPFMDGKLYLSKKGFSEEEELWHSVRYLSRYRGSPSGGVLREPLPETETEFWPLAAQKLAKGDIPTPARVGGHHTDFRIRPDIKPYGTTEIAFMDTAGAHPLKLLALQELLRAISWKLQKAVIENKKQSLPLSLFQTLTEQRLADLHQDSIAVAKNGIEAQIKGGNDQKYPVSTLWQELIEWVNIPDPKNGFSGLPRNLVKELNKSAQVVPADLLRAFQDKKGFISTYGFYETGRGTLSQWLLARAHQLVGNGLSEEKAVKNCITDLGYSYHYYLAEIGPREIERLLE